MAAVLCSVALSGIGEAAGQAPGQPDCDRIEGRVAHGGSFESISASGFVFRLEPIGRDDGATGWTIRVFRPEPAGDREAAPDLSRYATRPVDGADPRRIIVDESRSAAEAVAWSDRRFRFATGPSDHQVLATAMEALRYPHDYAAETLAEARRAIEELPLGTGRLSILEATTREPDEEYPRGLIERLELAVEICPPGPDTGGRGG